MIATRKIQVIKSDEEREKFMEPENEIVIQQSIHAIPSENPEVLVTSEILENTRKVVSTQDVGVQMNSDFINQKFLSFIQSDIALNTLTGIESFEILETITEILKLVRGDKFENYHVKMNRKDRVIMTYMKLKKNSSYSFLAILFHCCSTYHCRRKFHKTIKLLCECLKPEIVWPTKQKNIKNPTSVFLKL